MSLSPPVSLLLPPPELLPVAARVELPPLAACSALRLLLLSEKKRQLQATFLRWPLRVPNGSGQGRDRRSLLLRGAACASLPPRGRGGGAVR